MRDGGITELLLTSRILTHDKNSIASQDAQMSRPSIKQNAGIPLFPLATAKMTILISSVSAPMNNMKINGHTIPTVPFPVKIIRYATNPLSGNSMPERTRM
jgi:hypothetical protein